MSSAHCIKNNATKSLEILASEHDQTKRPYPRPRDTCDDCHKPIVLRWGEERCFHWAHLSKGECKSVSIGESATHKLAKKKLIDFLRVGGNLSFECRCSRCFRAYVDKVPKFTNMDIRFEEEVKYDSTEISTMPCVWDVAAIDGDGKIAFAIEILYKHKTSNILARENVSWFEISAVDILNALDVKDFPVSLSFSNKRSVLCKNSLCISLTEIASKLGYLNDSRAYACEARRVVDEAILGYYNVDCKLWQLHSIEDDNDDIDPSDIKKVLAEKRELWKELLIRKRCMRCQKSWNTSYKKPFCLSCYKLIKEDNKDIKEKFERKTTSIACKEKLRKQLQWLNDVPGGWSNGSSCYFCERSYVNVEENETFKEFWNPTSNYVCGYVWWFGEKKRCCTVCLDSELRTRGIIE